jgi:hypothetical protein
MCHGREVQLAQVNEPKQALALFSGFGSEIIRMALVLALEPGWVFCHVDIDPLFVVIKEDTEGWFGHFSASKNFIVAR